MKYITELQKFIINNKSWKEMLIRDPYNLIIKEKGNLIKFKYNQINSDPYNSIVQECRGIILDKRNWEIVCFPFTRFYNYGEGACAPVNFKNSKIQEKIDGSIISCYYYDGEWRVATNGMIDAGDCELPNSALFGNPDIATFEDLFISTARERGYQSIYRSIGGAIGLLDSHNTYIFELTSLYNKVVISYETPDIHHLGTRNNLTGEELNVDIGVPKPKEFTFDTIEDVIATARELPFNKEGYVVVDSNWNRCKIKGVAYLNLHHLKGEGIPSEKRLLELVRKNEGEEFLAYFAEYEEPYKRLEKLFKVYVEKVEKGVDKLRNMEYTTRKEFAKEASQTACPSFAFACLDKKASWDGFAEFCKNMKIDALLGAIKK